MRTYGSGFDLSSRLLLKPFITLWSWLTGRDPYTSMQKFEYRRGTSDHLEHNQNTDLFKLMLEPASEHATSLKSNTVLDFGCGQGRNVENLRSLGFKGKIIGVDISKANIQFCENRFSEEGHDFYCIDGRTLQEVRSETVSSAISTIVFQHIPVYSVRDSLLRELFRALEPGGKLIIQMGFGESLETLDGRKLFPYNAENINALGSNGSFDVQVRNVEDLEHHLSEIGFRALASTVVPSFSDNQHEKWIFTQASKP